jgi:hypothetical protein
MFRLPKLPPGLVEDWRRCWRWNSQQVAAIIAVFNAAQTIPFVQHVLTSDQILTVNALLGIVAILARLRDQPNA